jgi:hypothetical protein
VPTRFIRFQREPHGFGEPHHLRIRDWEENRVADEVRARYRLEAAERKNAEAAASKKTTNQ